MSTVTQALEKLFIEKEIPVEKQDIDDALVIYTVEFNLKTTHVLRLEIITEKNKEMCDVQITYRYVSYLSQFDKRQDLFEVINALNESSSGYYTVYLAQDGEIYMKKLVRTNTSVLPIYDMIVQGPPIVRHILPQIEQVAGVFDSTKMGL